MKYWRLFLHFLLVICTFEVARPLKILALIGTPIEKHSEWYRVLFSELSSRKHKLTIVTTYSVGAPILGTPPIILEFGKRDYRMKEFPYTFSEGLGPINSLSNLNRWYQAQADHCDHIMQGPGYEDAVSELINKPLKFDLILYDITFDPWCVLTLADFYPNVSIFALSAFKALPEHFEIARGGQPSPGVTPHFISHYHENMGILERYWNTILYIYGYYLKSWTIAGNIEVIMDKNLAVRNYGLPKKLSDVMSRIKLIFVNSHPAIDYSIPLPPNIIEIGGMHLKQAQKVPDATETHINTAIKGAIYMDLGKHMTIAKMDAHITTDIINVINSMPDYVFLWKVEDHALLGRRRLTKQFYPGSYYIQSEVLAHPKVKLFITEADHLNIQEAIYFGVPLVVIPLNMDQPNNAVRVEERKFGHYILYKDINQINLLNAIVNTLNCTECAKSVQMAKRAFHSNSQTPLDTVVRWIETDAVKYPESYDYIISRSAKNHGVFVTSSLDIILLSLIFLCVLTPLLFLIWCLIKCIWLAECCESCVEWVERLIRAIREFFCGPIEVPSPYGGNSPSDDVFPAEELEMIEFPNNRFFPDEFPDEFYSPAMPSRSVRAVAQVYDDQELNTSEAQSIGKVLFGLQKPTRKSKRTQPAQGSIDEIKPYTSPGQVSPEKPSTSKAAQYAPLPSRKLLPSTQIETDYNVPRDIKPPAQALSSKTSLSSLNRPLLNQISTDEDTNSSKKFSAFKSKYVSSEESATYRTSEETTSEQMSIEVAIRGNSPEPLLSDYPSSEQTSSEQTSPIHTLAVSTNQSTIVQIKGPSNRKGKKRNKGSKKMPKEQTKK